MSPRSTQHAWRCLVVTLPRQAPDTKVIEYARGRVAALGDEMLEAIVFARRPPAKGRNKRDWSDYWVRVKIRTRRGKDGAR